MNKKINVLLSLLLLVSLVVTACTISTGNPADTDGQAAETNMETTDESVSVEQTEEPETEFTDTEANTEEDPAPVTLFENDDYTITLLKNQCYINFTKGNRLTEDEYNPGVGFLEFDSIAHMKESFLNGSAASNNWMFRVLRSAFANYTGDNGIIICNLDSLYQGVYPDDIQPSYISLSVNSNYILNACGSEDCSYVNTFVATKGRYDYYYSLAFAFSNAPVTNRTNGVFDGVACEIIEYEHPDFGNKCRDHVFDIDNNGITYHVNVKYPLESPDSGDLSESQALPSEVWIFWQQDGQYFFVRIYTMKIEPTIEWLSSFGVVPYADNTDPVKS